METTKRGGSHKSRVAGKGKWAGARSFWRGEIPKRLVTAVAVRKRLEARHAAMLKEVRKVETFQARIEKAILGMEDAGQTL